MSNRARSPGTKRRHRDVVQNIAEDYFSKGYKVKADHIDRFSKPQSYHGRVPDVVAINNGHKTLVEVETKDSVDTERAKKQLARFKSWASKKSYRHFRREIV